MGKIVASEDDAIRAQDQACRQKERVSTRSLRVGFPTGNLMNVSFDIGSSSTNPWFDFLIFVLLFS